MRGPAMPKNCASGRRARTARMNPAPRLSPETSPATMAMRSVTAYRTMLRVAVGRKSTNALTSGCVAPSAFSCSIASASFSP